LALIIGEKTPDAAFDGAFLQVEGSHLPKKDLSLPLCKILHGDSSYIASPDSGLQPS
jgi:hypothetical protein